MSHLEHPIADGVAQPEELNRTVDGRGGRAERDQRVHIGRALKQTGEAVGEIMEVEIEDRKQQEELRQRQREQVPVSVEEGGKRPVKHMPHADIKEKNGKNARRDQLVLLGADLLFLSRGSFRGRFSA